MMVDRSKRLITLGEASKDSSKHVEFSPVHHYDEEVEFVSEIHIKTGENKIAVDIKPVNAKENEIE